MVELASLTLALNTQGMVPSFRSVFDVLLALDSLPDSILEHLSGVLDCSVPGSCVLLDDGCDLFVRKALDVAAPRTSKLEALKFDPSDWYLELCAAIARDGHADILFSHGWPILSVVGRSSTVTDAGGSASAPGGGL